MIWPGRLTARRRRFLVAAACVVVVLAATLSVLLIQRYKDGDIRVGGSFTAAAMSGSSTAAMDVWKRSQQPGVLPWENVRVARIKWSTEGSSDTCQQAIIILHPRDWQASAITDSRFARGETGPYVDAIAAEHPEVLAVKEPSDNTVWRIEGTFLLSSDPTAKSGTLDVMWGVPKLRATDIRVANAVFCGGDLAVFAWMTQSA